MDYITEQIMRLRAEFDNKNIKDKTSRAVLSQDEFDGIIYIIKHETVDGVYEVSEDISIILADGLVTLEDNE